MAEAVMLFSVVEGILENLASEPFKQVRRALYSELFKQIGVLPLDFMAEVRKLENTMSTIKGVLLDAEEKKVIHADQVKMLLERHEDVIYEADNLVDEFCYEQLRQQMVFGKEKATKVRSFFSVSNQLVFNLKMAKKIRQIRVTLDEIKAKRDFHLEVCVLSTMNWKETHSFVSDYQVIERDADKEMIMKFLLADNTETGERVPIVSLVGFGGLGKTTLAQFVFNDEKVKSHFEITMWVCVSGIFDLKLLVQKIIRSLTSESPDPNLDLEQLQNQLTEQIKYKKYLLVLDDVSNEDSDEWDELRTFLNLGAPGSRVLITTRSIRVAQIVHSNATHMLSGLNKEESWALFKRIAFNEGFNEPTTQYYRFLEMGKDIVDKCKGVPLAIKTIGKLLQSKKYSSHNLESEWKLFRNNELVNVAYQNDTNNIMARLKLSYNNLPPHLKYCFAYCSLFPKDHRINVQQLIKLWTAQGFIKPNRNGNQLEEIGYEYFMILFSRCFFQEEEYDELSSTTIEYCKMHHLIHDLACLVAGKCINILDGNLGEFERHDSITRLAENAFQKVHHIHVNFRSDSSCKIPTPLLEQKMMRTFILPESKRLSSSQCDGIMSNFRFLRSLSLRMERNVETLPNSLGKLKHLRYLDLSNNPYIKELPDSITNLYNLQTLILSFCSSLVSLPSDVQNLVNLRHLEIKGCQKLTHMPHRIGKLTSLQTLDMFVVEDNTSSDGDGFGELSKLNNLRGCLTIKIFGLGESWPAPCLKDKEHLESLVLSWEVEETTGDYAEKAFDCLEPPQNIKSIQVLSYSGQTFPNYFSFLTNLVRLEFSGCEKCKCLPPLHDLSSLQELKLNSLSALEYVSEMDREWNIGVCFPSLTTLVISECVNLKGWWGRKGKDFGEEDFGESLTEKGKDFGEALTKNQQPSFPNLSKLIILHCPLLTSLPLFPNLQDLKLQNTNSKALDSTVAAIPSELSSYPSSSSPSPLSQLKHLDIQLVDDLESLLPKAIHNLSLLQSLSINNCSNLASIPEGISNLKLLEKLQIYQCPKLTSLPEGMGSLSSLAYLTIVGCDNLTSIPQGISSLRSLTYITIVGCSNMTKIPKEIGSLPSLKVINGEPCTEIPMDSLADYLLLQNSPA